MHFYAFSALCVMLLSVFSTASPTDSKFKDSIRALGKRAAPQSAPPIPIDQNWLDISLACSNPRPANASGRHCNCFAISGAFGTCPDCSEAALNGLVYLYECHTCYHLPMGMDAWPDDNTDDQAYQSKACEPQLKSFIEAYKAHDGTHPNGNREVARELGPMVEHQQPSPTHTPTPAPTPKPIDDPWDYLSGWCSAPRGTLPFPEACNCQTINTAKIACSQPGACSSDAQKKLQAMFDCHQCASMGPSYGWNDPGYRDPNDDAIYRDGQCFAIVAPRPTKESRPHPRRTAPAAIPSHLPRDAQDQGPPSPISEQLDGESDSSTKDRAPVVKPSAC